MRRDTRRKVFLGVRHALLSFWLLISIIPIYWMVTTAFKLPEQWYTWPPTWFPSPPTLENFYVTWMGYQMIPRPGIVLPTINLDPLLALGNSVVIAGSATLLSVVIGLLLAYGVSRYQIIPEKRMFNLLILRMMPPIVIAIPLVIWYSTLKFLDTWHGMIIIYTITTIPYAAWMTKSFIDEVPEEMEQAALGIASEVDAGDASPGLQQCLEIAQGLSVGERAETEALAGDVEVGVVRDHEL